MPRKRKSTEPPEGAILLTTYAELLEYALGWSRGNLSFVMVVGPRGIQKSTVFEQATADTEVCKIDGNSTAFGAYRTLYEHRDHPVIIDDVDGIFGCPNFVKLLKALCDTKPRKRVAWINDRTTRNLGDLPPYFSTTSSVVLIANEWLTLNENVAAVQDRGHCLFFDPPPVEIHMRTALWFDDQEIFDFVAEHLHLVGKLSMRHYVLAKELKNDGKDWQKRLLGMWLQGPELIAARLMADTSFSTEAARVEAFRVQGGGCKQTFYTIRNHLRLDDPQNVPKITLDNQPLKTVPFKCHHAPKA